MNLKMIGDRYEIKNQIGSGGMADVYLAQDTVLKRDVAIKVLRSDLSNDPVSLLRFQREAHAGSGLNHPNIVEIYDVGNQDNLQYIVLEYIEGVTAKEMILRRGPIDVNEAVDFMIQLARGVSKAHSEGIVHRDIKPQNILVKGDGTLKVSDFGIAQAGDALQLTKTDSVMGSIHYLAPEVVRGEGASFASDIYAMGIIFYELLVGSLPFDAKMPVEIAMMQLRDPLPSVQKNNPTIPNSIVNVINKATAKSIKNRYKSVQEMLDDLLTVLDKDREDELLWVPVIEDNGSTKMLNKLEDVEVDNKTNKNKKRKWWIIGGTLVALFVTLIVFLALNSKPTTYLMEDLSGLTIEEAEEILSQYNITIAKRNITYEFSETIEAEHIITTSPEIGAEVPYGSQIRVILSDGPLFEVEDYSGKDIDEIRTLLSENTNLYIRVTHESSQDHEPGIILRQEGVLPGEEINPKLRREIVLVVASEVEISVPNLIGTPVNEAKAMLEKQGISVSLVKLSYDGLSNAQIDNIKTDHVESTKPIAGSTYIQAGDNQFVIEYYASEDKPDTSPDTTSGQEDENA
ncbi:MAG TPA: Stk1 family PASTA domain-containing Ser/Thr kinase [Erysipelothrix sp.]|nr:Stk1 family PASTA domain-containing Ser/Thr kinase [Erysipelothrix sp.]